MNLTYRSKFREEGEKPKLSFAKTTALYDELYEKAVLILEKYNPCKIEGGACLSFSRVKYCCDDDGVKCCFLSKDGCKTKSLSCKLYLCDTAAEASPECFSELVPVIKMAYKYDFLGYQKTKEDILERFFPSYKRKEKRPPSKFRFAFVK